ncbi:MAG: DUF1819 family protein [Eubacterium sp.]|jgi:hypothetical protein|nr:DUF1819 family protein [Eubacterium sp.]NBI87407.1 DUF1819 family protein [Lachnospiraceae bacterium]
MERKEYSAGAVKHSFWFIEFRNEVKLLSEGLGFEDIKERCRNENIFAAATPERAAQVFNTVSSRIKAMGDSFYPVFLNGDVSAQKIFNLAAVMVNDTLFFDFVYEVIREKMIIGSNEYTPGDLNIFFKDKQLQSEKVAGWTDATFTRLARNYKTFLFEAGMTDKGKDARKIFRPILEPDMERWLLDSGMEPVVKAFLGVR